MILDLFAGPGGWDVAAQQLGLNPLGVEFDDAACATRRAAGLAGFVPTDVREFPLHMFDTLDGLIASPPCQTFSMAGKGAGRQALEQVLLGVKRVATGEPIPYDEYDDIRTGLVLEPLRYALELEPDWICWEQVPTVQPVWDACAEVLRQDGYSVWTGHLHAEQYGVPQTRKRSVLIASRTRTIDGPPPPTHSRFYSRNRAKLDPGVLKWVSMAEALGWGMTQRPSMTVTGGGTATGGAEPFGNAARQGMQREAGEGRWLISPQSIAGGPRAERSEDEPSVTVTSNFDRARFVLRNNTSANACERTPEEPAPTLYFGARANGVYWQMGDVRDSHGCVRSVDEPSPSITSSMDNGNFRWVPTPASTDDTQDDVAWVYERPSPTIVGSFAPDVVAAPGYRTTVSRQNAKGSVRVTVQEAAMLQSFPPDYPWQGSKTKQYQQVGNALCPLLALHILHHATGIPMPADYIAHVRSYVQGESHP